MHAEYNEFDDIDPDILDIFLEESRDLMDACDQQLAALRDNPAGTECIVALQRSLHTLKGGARMAGITPIGNLSHGIETFLEVAARRRLVVEDDALETLGQGLDLLRDMVDRAVQRIMAETPHALIQAFEQLAGVQVVTGTKPASVDASHVHNDVTSMDMEEADAIAHSDHAQQDDHSIVDDRLGTETGILSNQATILSGLPSNDATNKTDGQVRVREREARKPARPRATAEQVRIQADLLDLLVNRADEMAVQRAHLEQQLTMLRTTIQELGRTHARMRDQLRRLDQETEAQIVSRYQREREKGDHAFDPLELDQFSSLQQLSRALTESSDDISGLNDALDAIARQYDQHLQQQARAGSELHDGLLQTRMLPFDKMAPRLSRIVRLAATEVGKRVRLDLQAASGELDRNVLERIIAPLEHMLRNSIVHGIEAPEARRAAGKSEEGTIRIALRNEGPEIVITVSDDGGGLNREAIRKRAEQQGLIKPGDVLGDRALDDMIFAAGFSTASKVDQLAGRGVGMDVVRNEVRQLGGNIETHSIPGQGVMFTMRLPQKVAVVQAVFVRSGELVLAVPTTSIIGIGQGRNAEKSVYQFGGVNYPIYTLRLLAGLPPQEHGSDGDSLLLVRSGDLTAAVCVDQVLATREVVVKAVGNQLATIPGIYGATIDEGGRAVVILDVAPLVRHHLNHPPSSTGEVNITKSSAPMVMVVDDSITMRKITGRVLERHKFEVKTARDGVDALEQMENVKPDLMLLDIEMPRMDGYELAGRMHNDPRYRDIPIIMITSRTGNKHRQRALDLGVRQYLGKPYQENELLRHVHQLLGLPTGQFEVNDSTQGPEHGEMA